MAILLFLLHVAAATMFLLFGVRMVQSGVERAYGAQFRRLLTQSGMPLRVGFSGFVLAVLLQSSAAVALLASGFLASGIVGFSTALTLVLGADFGSAFLVRILTFKLDWLLPVLLLVGAVLFLKSDRRKLKQAGRIALGIGIILISLQFLREAVEPIRDSSFLPAVSGFLERDFVTAFLVGAVLTFLMHSSIAAILMCVTLVSVGALPVGAGMSVVLGANLGSALVPVWLSRGMSAEARRVPLGNLLLRGVWAILALVLVNIVLADQIAPLVQAGTPEQVLVYEHIAFNSALLIFIPFVSRLEPLMIRLLPSTSAAANGAEALHRSALDDQSLGNPNLALAALRREVLRMLQLVEAQSHSIPELFHAIAPDRARALTGEDDYINDALDSVRRYVAKLPKEMLSKEDRKIARELAEYAIALEQAGDVIVKRLVPRAIQMEHENLKFSSDGLQELQELHEALIANLSLAANVLISDDLESARILLEEKGEMARRERRSRKRHLKRLTYGDVRSIATSNVHLETLKALKDINSQVASVAYPILLKGGQLLETRLIQENTKV